MDFANAFKIFENAFPRIYKIVRNALPISKCIYNNFRNGFLIFRNEFFFLIFLLQFLDFGNGFLIFRN